MYNEAIDGWVESGFISPGGDLMPKLLTSICNIEGKGTLLYHLRQAKAVRKDINTAVIMLGYRNASFFVAKNGNIFQEDCSDIGFNQLLKKIVSLTSGYSVEELLVPVSRYRSTDGQESELHTVMRFEDDDPNQKKELAGLIKAIDQADRYYVKQIVDWLSEFFPRKVDEIVLAGGTSSYILQTIAEPLAKYTTDGLNAIHLYDDLPPEIAKIPEGHRYLDIYGIWSHVQNIKD